MATAQPVGDNTALEPQVALAQLLSIASTLFFIPCYDRAQVSLILEEQLVDLRRDTLRVIEWYIILRAVTLFA